jgi:monovalent cation/hydrogen antiporter
LLLSHKRDSMLTYLSRIQGANVWSTVGFVFNGIIFMLIGLQLPSIIQQLGDISLSTAIGYGLLISAVLIVARLLCTLGASLFTRFMSNFITVAETNPGWRGPLVLGWAGMRGVVSLAMALSIPALTNEGEPFPQRNLILFITFIVILVTLVFQGLTLPWVIRKVRPENRRAALPELEQEKIIQKKMAHAALQFINDNHSDSLPGNAHLSNLYSRFDIDLKHFTNALEKEKVDGQPDLLLEHQMIALKLLDEQRKLLHKMNQRSEFDEDIIRKYLSLLDLEETKLREKLPQQTLLAG